MKVASVLGSLPLDFAGTLPEAPSADQVRPIHDLKTDFVPDRKAVAGFGPLYVLAHGALEDDPQGVEAFDLDLVLGMSRDARIFYNSVDLDTTEGLEPAPKIVDDRPLAAGYHLSSGLWKSISHRPSRSSSGTSRNGTRNSSTRTVQLARALSLTGAAWYEWRS